jgi:hypothetical protein
MCTKMRQSKEVCKSEKHMDLGLNVSASHAPNIPIEIRTLYVIMETQFGQGICEADVPNP